MKSPQTWWHSECAVPSKKQLSLILLLLHSFDRRPEIKMAWEETGISLLCSILAPRVSREEQPEGAQHPHGFCSHPAAAHAGCPAALLWRQEFLWLLLYHAQQVQDRQVNKYFKASFSKCRKLLGCASFFPPSPNYFFLILSSKTLQLTKISFSHFKEASQWYVFTSAFYLPSKACDLLKWDI